MIKLYKSKAKGMSTGGLRYAVSDIKATWEANPATFYKDTDYALKLLAEHKAYSSELKYRDGPTNAQMKLEILRRSDDV